MQEVRAAANDNSAWLIRLAVVETPEFLWEQLYRVDRPDLPELEARRDWRIIKARRAALSRDFYRT